MVNGKLAFTALRFLHETFRNSRGVGSSSTDCSPASGAREIVDGSGCGGELQRLLGQALERGVGCRRSGGAEKRAASRPQASAGYAAAAAIVGRLETRSEILGLLHRGME